jgi:thiosulfate dehydrogenase
MNDVEVLIQATRRLTTFVLIFIICVIGSVVFHFGVSAEWFDWVDRVEERLPDIHSSSGVWQAPDPLTIPKNEEGELISYGRELIQHTGLYLGPKGKVRRISNGMNCQNCHLQGGTKPFAANYSAVASTYPKRRKRSGQIEGFERRVNDCLERSLNGSKLAVDSREMKAMVAYLIWVGKDVERGKTPEGWGLKALPLLNRAADPVKGQIVYGQFCARCHGDNGEGIPAENNVEWKYPPLWGSNSYNTGAGLFRISKFAAFVKANMPYGISYENALLTDEEAWDVAAYVNSRPRPHKEFPGDWPELADKPVDHPFGPYADNYPEEIHKFGPFHLIPPPKKQ